jgi:putative transposase
VVAQRFAVSLGKVQYWVAWAGEQRLDRIDFTDRQRGRPANRTEQAVEELVVQVRQELRQDSALGEYGDAAIHRALQIRELARVPSVRTIGRILARRGVLDGRRRRRFPAPPAGWYLPAVRAGQAELDSFDLIEDLRIAQGPFVDVLTAISLHGALVAAWPLEAQASARWVLERLVEYWRVVGLPSYAQFDNDTRFQGAHQHRDVISRVMRACLSLGVTPVFIPPRESGFQAAIEAFNGRWQKYVWARYHHASVLQLAERSARYILAHRERHAARIDHAPARRPFPANWNLDLQAVPPGRLIYLRRTTEQGSVNLLGHNFRVDPHWPHRLVRCEVDLDPGHLRFFALRRRDPDAQPLLAEFPHVFPHRKFHE